MNRFLCPSSFPALALGLALSFGGVRAEASPATETLALPGLSAPGEILIDRWGVPHIYAQKHYDAFFLQGFNAARDRLWQIDLWRRRGLGELAEVFGPEFVAQDAAARQFLYRGSLFREWLAYGSDAQAIAEAFVAGINAFVALTEADPSRLPSEFKALDYRPARWAAEDVVRIRSHGLWRNVISEVARARSACRGALAEDQLRSPLEPPHVPTVPEGLDPCSVPEGVLDSYLLATSAVKFKRSGDQLALAQEPLEARVRNLRSAGSNNWVVAPERSATGRPILADDPHRSHALPSLRYIAHLNAPDLNVIGAGEPALPGISIGHNERIAFGLTIFAMDQEDLLFYNRDGDRYRYQDRWEPLERVETTIAVRGAAPVSVSLAFTRHGPVIFEEDDRLWVVRAAWLEPGMAPYFGSIEYMRASNWRGFVAALNRWGAPSENQVYADVDGNIGYKPAGLLPRRVNYDGLLPVPGDGRYEWADYHPMSDMPEVLNPEKGWYATANNLTLPEDFPMDTVRVGYEWTAPWRIARIEEVLSSAPPHRLEDSLALQRDFTSVLARRASAALSAWPRPRGDKARRAFGLLEDFDGVLNADSAAAALFQLWFTDHWRRGLVASEAPALAGAFPRVDTRAALERLEVREPRLQGLFEGSLADAWEDAVARLGADPARWRWGALHTMNFTHPLAEVSPAAAAWSLPPKALGGSSYTVNNTSFGEDYRVRSGASWRMVLDVGDWDEARMTNAPGQSGVQESPHYGDLLDPWATLESRPLLYSREAVEKATTKVLKLIPAQ